VLIYKYIHTYKEKLSTARAPRHFKFIYRVNYSNQQSRFSFTLC